MVNICNIGKLKIFVKFKAFRFYVSSNFYTIGFLAESYRNPFDILYSWKV